MHDSQIVVISTILGLNEDKYPILDALYELCLAEALNYTHKTEEDNKLTPVIINMVIERYNRIGSEGVSSQSFSGISESFVDGYSANIIKQLDKNRKVTLL